MKKLVLTLALVTSSLSVFAADKVNVTVKGMVCSFCSQGITKKFKDQGVKDIKVDLGNHLVTIEFAEGKPLTDEVITKVLSDAGYGVEKIEKSN